MKALNVPIVCAGWSSWPRESNLNKPPTVLGQRDFRPPTTAHAQQIPAWSSAFFPEESKGHTLNCFVDSQIAEEMLSS